MIYILSGNDIKNKNVYLKKLYKENQPIFVPEKSATKEILFDYALSNNLFGESSIIVFENILKREDIAFTQKDLLLLKDSKAMLVFIEEKLLAPEIKKYENYAIIEDFSSRTTKQVSKMNIFNIADAFSCRDKIGTWILYREAVSLGIPPEEISGIIFWKVKTMLLTGTKFFSADELKKQSSKLVSIYHKAHRGECDFIIGLEQFILSALDK